MLPKMMLKDIDYATVGLDYCKCHLHFILQIKQQFTTVPLELAPNWGIKKKMAELGCLVFSWFIEMLHLSKNRTKMRCYLQ